MTRVDELDVDQCLLEMLEQGRHMLLSGVARRARLGPQEPIARSVGAPILSGNRTHPLAHFQPSLLGPGTLREGKTEHLHGLGKIERSVAGCRGDGEQGLTSGNLLDRETRALGAEHEGHAVSGGAREFRMGLLDNKLGRKRLWPEFPALRADCDRQAHILDRLLERGDLTRLPEQIDGAAREGYRLRVREHAREARLDDDQTAQTHHPHGPRRGTDITGMGGANEHEADTLIPVGDREMQPLHRIALEWRVDRRPGLFFTMHPMLNVAVRAARRAGRIINRASLDLDTVKVARKQRNDFVTEVDHAAEEAIIETLIGAYPGHSILAEESGHTANAQHGDPRQADFVWIIDPLDGTTNFIHGFPQYAVSIALMQKGQVTQAVVYDPSRDELFTATRGRGAFLNDRRIRVSKQVRIDESLIGTGFPFKRLDVLDHYIAIMRSVMMRAAGLRRPGAAALDLAYVAAGRLDGFFEFGLAPWDAAAGSLLITEAGGLVGNFKADGDYLFSEQIVAGTPKVFAGLIAMLSEAQVPASTPRPSIPPPEEPAVRPTRRLSQAPSASE
jgi:myo-inositol-1(or 4)-monophosphatase